MKKIANLLFVLLKSPFLWGVLGTIGFYALVHGGPLGWPLVKRYFAGHPVEYIETLLFFIGLAALLIKAFDTAGQRSSLRAGLLGPLTDKPLTVGDARALLDRLNRLPYSRQNEYYVARLRAALEHLHRRGSADALDDELKYLADLDAARLHATYGLFRVIVWAIPILGFLGTVIGITMALNGVDLKAPDQSMFEVLNGLGVKFDTTALALTLALILMFINYFVERAENNLLEEVDRRIRAELVGCFVAAHSTNNNVTPFGNLQAANEALLQACEQLFHRQSELWRAAVEAAAQEWNRMASSAAAEIKAALSEATTEMAQRAESLEKAVAFAGDVVRLEEALNRNLAILASTQHLEQTILSLAAAANLLAARLADASEPPAAVRLEPLRKTAQAA